MKKINKWIIIIVFGFFLWSFPILIGKDYKGWNIFVVFLTTILSIIIKPISIGSISIISLTIAMITNLLTVEESLKGYSKETIWLILLSFFISLSLKKTGLGKRISYFFVYYFGKNSLGLSYSLVISEFLLSPLVPSVTARTGGIILPIINSLSRSLKSFPNNKSKRRIGEFLILSSFQCSVVTSAMFITSMAANPIMCDLAKSQFGINISWIEWAKAAFIPGTISITIIPLFIFFIRTPYIKKIDNFKAIATSKLKKMGKISYHEIFTVFIFLILIVLWTTERITGISSLTAAFIGVSILLIFQIISFSDILNQSEAWSTYVWFGALVTLADSLNKSGLINLFKEYILEIIKNIEVNWFFAFIFLSIFYFYTHYIFASSIAHISTMYILFLSILIKLNSPILLTILVFSFLSSLYSCLTHYGIGSAPVLYGSGYVATKIWWKIGLFCSFINLFIWLFIGSIWWKFLKLW
jgi:DASS family divalent anion:Na+ symporter